jgi:hypothetical protein
MKYLVIAKPGKVSPPPETLPALLDSFHEYASRNIAEGKVEAAHLFAAGGGFSVVNADSHEDLMDNLQQSPVGAFSDYEIHPLLDFDQGMDRIKGHVQAGIRKMRTMQ